jgi:hypothetical protein
MNEGDRKLLNEIADRARRTETRVTKVANHLGIDAGGEKPSICGSELRVPTIKTSLEDIIAAIGNFDGPITIRCGDDYLGTIYAP